MTIMEQRGGSKASLCLVAGFLQTHRAAKSSFGSDPGTTFVLSQNLILVSFSSRAKSEAPQKQYFASVCSTQRAHKKGRPCRIGFLPNLQIFNPLFPFQLESFNCTAHKPSTPHYARVRLDTSDLVISSQS